MGVEMASLNQHALQMHAGQEILQNGSLVGFAGVVRHLGHGDPKHTGLDRDLRDEPEFGVG